MGLTINNNKKKKSCGCNFFKFLFITLYNITVLLSYGSECVIESECYIIYIKIYNSVMHCMIIFFFIYKKFVTFIMKIIKTIHFGFKKKKKKKQYILSQRRLNYIKIFLYPSYIYFCLIVCLSHYT